MRIGMDFRPAMRAPVGIGRYTANLAAALAPRPEVDLRLYGVFRSGNTRAVRYAPDGAKLAGWPVPSRVMKLLAKWRLLATERVLGGCDLYHHTNYTLAHLDHATPQVMTIHDLAFFHDAGYHTPRAATAMKEVMTRALDRCHRFLVPSEATARDCEAYLGLTRDRMAVTPLGVEDAFFDLGSPPPAHPRPYLLAVGTLEPRKNYPRLIRAFAASGLDLDLCVAGEPGWLSEDVQDLAAATPRVHLLGRVDETRLRALLAGAEALCYVSLHEGFGLPALEGLAAGKAVLTSDRAPLSEIAGDAALLVDPEDEDAIAQALVRLVTDSELRARLSARGPARAREFTWRDCADRTQAEYRKALA